MIGAALHRFIQASLYPEQTVFPALSSIDHDLRACRRSEAAVQVLEKAKPGLYARLHARWSAPVAQALTLKILNIFLARYHLLARSAAVLSRPIGLVVDPSNMCQLACPGCVHSARSMAQNRFDWPKGTLPEERFSALMQLYGPYAIGVYFCNYGEPLLNLATPALVRLAKKYLLWTALSTSLSVKRFDPEVWLESGLDLMILAVDGATQPVYERFRHNGDLQLVFSNIRKLVDARRRRGRRAPVLCWNFLAFEHNAHEIPLALRTARQLGVDQFWVAKPFDVSWDDPAMRPAAVKTGVRRLDWASAFKPVANGDPVPGSLDTATIARVFDSPWNGRAADEAPADPGPTCQWLYKNMVMDATGRILPCCGAPRADVDLVFGTFDGSGDPFNSEKYRQARSFFPAAASASAGGPYCRHCVWDHASLNIGAAEIRRYFRAADAALFDRRSLSLLSG